MIARLERLKALSRFSESAVLVALPATICAFAMGSSSVSAAVRIGMPLRWVMLFALVACAAPYGLSQLGVLPRPFVAAIASIVGVALLSTLWSVTPRITAERAISFMVLMAAVGCIGAGAARSRAHIERLFISFLVAADLVAVAGVLVLLVDHQLAVQSSAPTMPARMRGFGQNPNTASMLFALALPIAEWLAVSTQRIWIRAAAATSCVLLYGSIMASGSRGAMLAAAAGTVLFVALLARNVRQLVPLEAVVLVVFVGTFQVSGGRPSVVPPSIQLADRTPIVVPLGPFAKGARGNGGSGAQGNGGRGTRGNGGRAGRGSGGGAGAGGSGGGRGNGGGAAHGKGGRHGQPSGKGNGNGTRRGEKPPSPKQQPLPSTAPLTTRFNVGISRGLTKALVPVPFVPRSSEIGHPSIYEYKPIIAYGSGRVFAWLSAIRQGLEVPALGYGFGTENVVFVDRSYVFEGAYTENSFVGMFLQLGLVGVLLLLVPFLFVASALLHAVRRRDDSGNRSILAATAAVVAGGFVVAFFQSYLYSVGNVATLTFWAAAAIAMTVRRSEVGDW